MNNNISLRTWIENFKQDVYNEPSLETQIKAGWYDWFCRNTSLVNKTKRMGKIIKQITDGGKIDLDNTYVWFKNNCPLHGKLYDDFRIASLENNEVYYTVQIDSPWEQHRYTVYSHKDFFDKPVLGTDSAKELVKWFNEVE